METHIGVMPRDEYLELVQTLAIKVLRAYWEGRYPNKEKKMFEKGGNYVTTLCEEAQEIFNKYYDEVDGEMLQAFEMKHDVPTDYMIRSKF
jgi:hypothetical protein